VVLTALVLPFSHRVVAAENGPALDVPPAKLKAAVQCPATFKDALHGPVLLVHGTFAEPKASWSWNYQPALTKSGFDVCTVKLPNYSLDDIQVQSEYVVFAIRDMASRSGKKVSVIGASQGTLQPRWAVKWWPDVRAHVDDIIFLAGPHHGTAAQALGTNFGSCFASCWQMRKGSLFLNALNAGDETPGNISYTSIYTLFDELVIPQAPVSTSMLKGASNIQIQSLCPGRPVEHLGISTGDAVGYALALDALTHPGPANPSRFNVATCLQPLMPGAEPLTLFTSGGSAGFNGAYMDHEPPLKTYALAASTKAHPAPGTMTKDDPSVDPAPNSGTSSANEAQVGATSSNSGGGHLPSAGAEILRYVALSLALIAAGLTLWSRTHTFVTKR